MALKVSHGESLDRYYLFKLFGFGLFLHKIHHSDPPDVYHSHPWNGISFIFGSYIEEYLDRSIVGDKPWALPRTVRRKYRFLRYLKADQHHRVEVDKPTWTLFLHFRKCNKWSIQGRYGIEMAEAPWEGAEGKKSYTAAIGKA